MFRFIEHNHVENKEFVRSVSKFFSRSHNQCTSIDTIFNSIAAVYFATLSFLPTFLDFDMQFKWGCGYLHL